MDAVGCLRQPHEDPEQMVRRLPPWDGNAFGEHLQEGTAWGTVRYFFSQIATLFLNPFSAIATNEDIMMKIEGGEKKESLAFLLALK